MNILSVSSVVGVILMVAITFAIAGTVYFYVSNEMYEDNTIHIEGNITAKYVFCDNSNHIIHYFVIHNYEIYVSMGTYYEYNIGDFYKQ
jgi:flagellin-like protein